MGRRRKKFWSYVAGERGRNWVRAFEKEKGGILFIEWYEEDGPDGKRRRKRASLGHRDREEAKGEADELAAAFLDTAVADALARSTPGGVTVHHLIDLYLESETPFKSRSKQGHDRRASAMFKKFFARTRRAETLNLRDWNRFIRARREYRVGPAATLERARRAEKKGAPLPPVGNRQIEYDLRFLWAVLNWATKAGDGDGQVLLPRHPWNDCVRSRHWPKEKNPDRPTLTSRQYLELLEVAPGIDWRFHVALVLAHETGHRIGSIRRLRWSDVEAREGWIRWRAESDKTDREHWTPLTEPAAGALRIARDLRYDGAADPESESKRWLLPSPADPFKPCSRNIMRDWWNAAQERAGLRGVHRLGWHSLRRKFANDLRHVPLKDLASLGGWKDTQTLLKCYLKENEEAMVEALRSRRSPHGRRLAGRKKGSEERGASPPE